MNRHLVVDGHKDDTCDRPITAAERCFFLFLLLWDLTEMLQVVDVFTLEISRIKKNEYSIPVI